MMKSVFLFLFLLSEIIAYAQFQDDFSDGNFSDAPTWKGHFSDWQIVASSDVSTGAANSQTLRLNALSGSGIKYLSANIAGSWGTTQSWSFWMGRRGQAATTTNSSYVWLWASEPDISSPGINGYRIRFGDDSGGDELHVEKISNGTASVFLTSSGAVTNGLTDVGFHIRITRSAAGVWNLYTSELPVTSGTGMTASQPVTSLTTPVFQGTATENLFNTLDNGFVVIAAGHSTGTSARAGAEFDNLAITLDAASPLPVRFQNLSASIINRSVRLAWVNASESDVQSYAVEYSENANDFHQVASIIPMKNDGSASAYEYYHHSDEGEKYYRIRATETNGNEIYSNILLIQSKANVSSLLLFPNPVTSDQMSISINNLPTGTYSFNILNNAGSVVRHWKTIHGGGPFSLGVRLGLSRGHYLLEVLGPGRHHQHFIIQ